MNEQNSLTNISEMTNQFISSLGITSEMLVIALLALSGLLLIIVAVLIIGKIKSAKPIQDPNMQLVAGLRGRLEKLEMSLNELVTQKKRSDEFNQLEFEYIKTELTGLNNKIKNLSDNTSLGSEFTVTASDSTASYKEDNKTINKTEIVSNENLSELEDKPTVTTITNTQPSFVMENLEAPTSAGNQKKNELAKTTETVNTVNTGLKKTRQGLFSKLKNLFIGSNSLDAEKVEELEALLISADLGPKTSSLLIEELNQQVKNGSKLGEAELIEQLKFKVQDILTTNASNQQEIIACRQADGPLVVLVVGVNGTGKTTSVAKLSQSWKEQGKKVLMVAADTFRAAAVEQLKTWGQRLDIPVISGQTDAKPATVVYDAMQESLKNNYDVVIIDTAGRLHNKSNLMQELEGINNAIKKHQPSAPHEVLLVLDGTSGQNALQQAKEFNSSIKLTGLIITKLDGTAKGGIVVAIKHELGIPLRYIGVGEGSKDLKAFNGQEFVDALFYREDLAA
jgi:fused signal recognition particle receptor